jgi:hypothetical protein
MIFGCCGIPFGFYFFFYHTTTYKEICFNNALIGASISVLAMGYLMYSFLKLTEKFKIELRQEHIYVRLVQGDSRSCLSLLLYLSGYPALSG